MMLALDESMLDYTLRWALQSEDVDEVNYICNRLNEAVPQLQKKHVLMLAQRLQDYFDKSDPAYLKASPLYRLAGALAFKLLDFKK